MSLPLLRKELREHGLVLLVSAALSKVALLGMLVAGEDEGGRFAALKAFVLSMGSLNALVTANRLFVREYSGRTQLFLEVLPIGRGRVFATKWLLGAFWMLALVTAAWASVLRYQRKTEVIATEDALYVLGAVALLTLAAWSFAALAGMLGRYRYVVWLALLFSFAVAIDAGNLAPDQAPVLNLLSDRVVMARGPATWAAMAQAAGVTAGCALGAALLALLGSGAIASTLARRMTARERVFVLVSVLVAGFVYAVVKDERLKPPFAVADAYQLMSWHTDVSVMATADMTAAQRSVLASLIAEDANAAIDRLGLSRATSDGERFHVSIIVLPQQGLDRTLVERGTLKSHDGIVLRAAPDVPEPLLRAAVVHDVLAEVSLGRALREDRHVLLDGFATRLVLRSEADWRELMWLRFASLSPPIDAPRLTRWEETMELLGPCGAEALAFAAVDTLAEQLGETRLHRVLGALFGRPDDNVRVLLEPQVQARLTAAGVSWPALAARVEARRVRLRAERASELQAIPPRSARIEVSRTPGRGASVRAHVAGVDTYRVLYAALGAWTRVAHPLSRLDVRGARDAAEVSATVPVSAPRGARIFTAIEVEEPVLQCAMRLHAARVVMP